MKNFSMFLMITTLIILANTTASLNQIPDYIQGCAKYDSNQQCSVCQYGYSNNDGVCNVNSDSGDCCSAYNNQGSCSRCAPGLYYNDPYCQRNSIYGCINKKDNQCLACGRGLRLVNGICHTHIHNCNNYTQSGQCNSCTPGFVLRNSYCLGLPQVQNCKVQSISGCGQCNEGFYLTADQKCSRNQFGCLKYWRQQCIACSIPFELQNGQCVILGCQSFDGRGCRQCQNGLTLQNGICLWNNCLRYSNGVCFECVGNYRLSAQGCVLPQDFQCRACSSGFAFVNNRCTRIIPGCNRYNSNGQCQQCRNGFQLTINGACQILGCTSYNNDQCVQCSSPFILSNKICIIRFCQQYSTSGCTRCQRNYLLSNRICVSQDRFCVKYNNQGVCIQCVNTHLLNNGLCVKGQRGCLYNAQRQCQCASNFYLNQQGRCQILGCSQYNSNDECLACFDPFSYDASTKICSITRCKDYTLTGCRVCLAGSILVNGRCFVQLPNCSTYNNQGACTQCRSGFKLDTTINQCVRELSNCLQLNPDRVTCRRCANNFVLLNGQCRANIPNCNRRNQNTFECQQCVSTHFLRQGQCVIRDQFCDRYQRQGSNDVCSACVNGYRLRNDGRCFKVTFGCVYDGSICISCKAPFIYNQRSATCSINGCQQYNQNGCTSCVSPFVNSNGNCVIQNCNTYNSISCVQCIRGFRLNNGICVTIFKNCVRANSNGCVQCRQGYLLQNGRCVLSDVNCLSYRQNGICSRCKDTHFLNSQSRCVPKIFGCIYERDICRRCYSPFVFNRVRNTCQVQNCAQVNQQGCNRCISHFILTNNKDCTIPNCLNVQNKACVQCSVGYHIKDNVYCQQDDLNCLSYNNDGDCQLCRKGSALNSNGICSKLDSTCIKVCSNDKQKCLECASGYVLNRYYQCQKISNGCIQYTNGVCSRCANRFFLYKEICFPYTKGCVKYNGKDCTTCRAGYVLKNAQCFGWKNKDLSLIGDDDKYDFLINPIDVRQSKYYIDNLSPASQLGKFYFSSVFDISYQQPTLSGVVDKTGKGWKSRISDTNQFIGILVNQEPVTFYAIQIQAVQGNYIQQFELQYSVDGTEFISVQNLFTVGTQVIDNIATIYFTGIYAKSIRIRITKYKGWPAARIDFFYYDMLRFRKISNLKSLKYLQETISSNYVDRVDNQIYINQAYFFNPISSCTSNELCFTGLQLCQKKKINQLQLNFQDGGLVTQFYLTYTVDGRSYNCFNSCAKISITGTGKRFRFRLKDLFAQGVRIYPTKYQGTPKFNPTFFYQ